MKLSDEDKKEIIRLNREEGISRKRLAKMYKVCRSCIGDLLAKHNLHGDEVLVKGPNRKYSPEFKMEIIKRYLEGGSISSLATSNNIQRSMIVSWLRRYEKDGYNGLVDKKKGRPPKMKKDRNTKEETAARETDEVKADSSDQARIKFLEKKNKELEAEVAYLKKLNALVQERKKRESKKK